MKKIMITFLVLFLMVSAIGQEPYMKPMLGRQINRGHSLSKGLVGCWLFNEGTGNKVYDSSGNQGSGTFNGTAPAWTNEENGAAVYLPGTNEYISTSKPNINGATALSVVIGINVVEAGANNAWFSLPVAYNQGFFLGRDGISTAIQCWVEAEKTETNAAAFSYGSHFQVAGVYNGTAVVKIYIDGTECSYALQKAGPASIGSSTGVQIGGCTVTGLYHNGNISYVYLYNRALSASEIDKLYRESFCMFVQDLSVAKMYNYGGAAAPTGQVILIQMSAIPLICIFGLVFLMRGRNVK